MSRVQVLLADLKDCSRTRNLERGRRVHGEALELGHVSNMYIVSALVNMYAKCGSMADAHQVFCSTKNPNAVVWNVLILGYADNGQGLTALELFWSMRKCLAPNCVTFVAALKACAMVAADGGSSEWAECRKLGMKIHELALKNDCYLNIYVQSTLIDLYAKCASMVDAYQVFLGMRNPNVVSWTVLIMGYADNGQGMTALNLFWCMRNRCLEPNSTTFVAALKACMSLALYEGPQCRKWGKQIHVVAIENDCHSSVHVQSTLIDMYSKCGSMVEARQVFNSMRRPDVVSWTALMLGYAENGQGLRALDLFKKMKAESLAPDSVTFMAAFKACSLVGGLEFGRTIHLEIHEFSLVMVTCLVDFYAKCGSLREAQHLFDLHAEARDIVTWTVMLAGFSRSGDHESVFGLFEVMQDSGLAPDSATFLSVLTCCSHAGLVEKGKECFDGMYVKYGIYPTVEHYTCMIDIFGRANKLEDAMALLKSMPCSPDNVTWTIVLGVCRKLKNVELGKLAFQSLDGSSASACALMGQIFEGKGMLQEQEMVTVMRNRLKAWKEPGEACWTNELGEGHTFNISHLPCHRLHNDEGC